MLRKTKVNESEVMRYGFLGGIGQALYCFLVVLFINMLDGAMPNSINPMFGFLMFLLLFVFSAGISGIIIFGYPTYLAFQKRYFEALLTVVTTLVTIMIVFMLVFVLVSSLQLWQVW